MTAFNSPDYDNTPLIMILIFLGLLLLSYLLNY